MRRWYFSRHAREKVLRQQRNVLAPLAQRRQLRRDHVEAVVQVLAELAAGDRLLQVAVGGRDDAHVDLARSVAADGPHLAFLQHAQQLDLQLQRHVADLVEEQRCRRRR
jgi:alpha-D-ribose 1-methylphosphonate 5-triphosphate synthase subunit PhnL